MDIKNKLKEVLLQHNINLNDNIINNLNNFNDLMLKYNTTHNLTAITEENDVIYKHYLDSLLGLNVFNDLIKNSSSAHIMKSTEINLNNTTNNKTIKTSENSTQNHIKTSENSIISDKTPKILDIGAGAGFPSIPLCIANNNLNITALDSVGKKTKFIELSKNNLQIDNLNVITARIEDIANKPEHREQYDYVISRAVAVLPTLLEYSAPMLKNNGKIIAYKGSNYQTELNSAQNAMKILNCTLDKVYEFNIPNIETTRYILVFTKNSNISTKYPRKQNKPRLQPL